MVFFVCAGEELQQLPRLVGFFADLATVKTTTLDSVFWSTPPGGGAMSQVNSLTVWRRYRTVPNDVNSIASLPCANIGF
jgi:hypothetical protein